MLCALFGLAAKPAVVPGRVQSVGEMLFELIDDLAHSIIGHEARRYVPLVFTLFTFIMTMNMLGMLVVSPPRPPSWRSPRPWPC